jgi:coenzyme F420-0:L-glutamate ligase/coenzyme F420-1:gamma-L-glutamate ligase
VADAVTATPGAPLRPDDVVVVTQKVVSKAEGAIVDLEGIEPRPEALEFGAANDRDPRQVEVVLREARRVVRIEHGVTSRPGMDSAPTQASMPATFKPGQGPAVTLRRAIPTALRPACAAPSPLAFGVEAPGRHSDSFAPWRWGSSTSPSA